MNINHLVTDILVVGSGGAGLRAAIEAAKHGSVLLVSKGPMGRSGATIMAGADVMLDSNTMKGLGFLSEAEGNDKERWAQQIIIEGFFLNEESLVQAYVEDAGDRVKELIDWGMKVEGAIDERSLLTTGVQISRPLFRAAKDAKIRMAHCTMINEVLLEEGRISGALGVNIPTGDILFVQCKAVILATGGWQQAFSLNSASDELTGDGQALAYRAGATLRDMEMITFCPNIIVSPARFRGSIFPYLLPGELLNKNGDAFLQWEAPEVVRLAKTSEWNKLVFSKATWREIQAGRGGPHGGVYFSLRHLPPEVWEELALQFPGWRFQGDNFSKMVKKLKEGYSVEVAPAGHYFEGGIKINRECATSVEGLFAAGECTGGLFGANRVSAATTEIVVQGCIAGRNAGQYVKSIDLVPVDQKKIDERATELKAPLGRRGSIRPSEVRQRLRDITYRKLGCMRTAGSLEALLAEVSDLEKSVMDNLKVPSNTRFNRDWVEAMELKNLLLMVKLAARAATYRTESRGVHYREDYPVTDSDNWLRSITIRDVGGTPEVNTKAVEINILRLPAGKNDYEATVLQLVRQVQQLGYEGRSALYLGHEG